MRISDWSSDVCSSDLLPCWVVFDKQYRDRYPVLTVRPGAPDPEWLLAHDTLEGLAAAAGIDPVGLADSVQRWNGFVADGRDRDYGRGDSLYDRFHEIGRASCRERVCQYV